MEGLNCLIIEQGMTSFKSWNCQTEKWSEAEFFCAVWKRTGVVLCSINKQSTAFHVLTVSEHSHIKNDVIAWTILWKELILRSDSFSFKLL